MNAPARQLLPIDQIVELLAGRAQALAAELLPGGKRDGHEWRCGSLAGEQGQSLAVHLFGAKAGVWKDFAGGESGDALDLVAQVLFRGDMSAALQWARRWLGLDSGDPAALAIARREAEQSAARREEQGAAEIQATRNAAFRMWLSAQNHILDTPVHDYLLGRGIDLRALGRQPGALRYHPALWNGERRAHLPAMVAAICDPAGKFIACHRTWLDRGGDGVWRKASLAQPKKVLGSYRAGMIRLWRPAASKPLNQAPDDTTVDITEGIEDGLSVAMALPECRVVAAISISNMANLVFPPAVWTVNIWRQNDTAPAALAAFDRVTRAFLERGLAVTIPDIPPHLKDVNDMMREPAA